MDDEEKRDRQMLELLNELRVALPGVQFLFAFLLTVPFAQGFERITQTQKTIFYAALLATAASTVFLIAPSATHRLRFHQRDRTFIIESANQYLIAGLVVPGDRARPGAGDGHRLPLRRRGRVDRAGRRRRPDRRPVVHAPAAAGLNARR